MTYRGTIRDSCCSSAAEQLDASTSMICLPRCVMNCMRSSIKKSLAVRGAGDNRPQKVATQSPHYFESLVEPELLIRRHNRNLLGQGLSNDLSIKWIAVMEWQPEKFESMLGGIGQDSNVQVLNRLMHGGSRQSQLTHGCLDGDFCQRNCA